MKQTFFRLRPPNVWSLKANLGWHIAFFGIWLIVPAASLFGQFEQTAPSKYRIAFTDKLNSSFTLDSPEDFLSQRAIDRRKAQGISISSNDLPVTQIYIDSLRNSGARILTVSKWFNAVTVQITDSSVLEKIASFSFVKKLPVQHAKIHVSAENINGIQQVNRSSDYDYGPSWWQTAVHNGQILHNKGYTGKNVVIAVIDAGFAYVDTLSVFNHLWENGRILGYKDFMNPGSNIFREASHGMSVLSIISGYRPGELTGTAPDASFWLLRSENVITEFIIEEDNWIAAAEFADSAGADLINSSLGYSEFDDPSQNHSYADMNGNVARVSVAADIAASKGILVVVSAGNQGNTAWKHITAPADADSALTIGAVGRSGLVAVFSSRGPSSDSDVKPNVMAVGQGTYVAGADGTFRSGNGTSYSAPVITGLAACLWQGNRDAKVMEIYKAICESGDRFYYPDENYGYGIPDFNLADMMLKAEHGEFAQGSEILAFPNPFYNQLFIFFGDPIDSQVDITLFDLTGKEVYHRNYPEITGRRLIVIDSDFRNLQKGLYIIRISAGSVSRNSKLVKY
jgi:hypothetical protein